MEISDKYKQQWQQALSVLATVTKADNCLLLGIDSEEFQLLAAYPALPSCYQGSVFPQAGTIHEYVIAEEETLILEDVAQADIADTLEVKNGVKAYYGCPVFDSDNILFGLISLSYQEPCAFTPLHHDFIQQTKTYVELGLELVKEKEYLQLAYETIRKSVEEIKVLREILPICANCKKVRNDDGYWDQVETYLKEHSEINFSHCICPDCLKELYPDFADKILAKEQELGDQS